MNPILLSFADGTSFFIGLGIVLIANSHLLRFRSGFLRPVPTILILVGIILVVISATPLPVWAYALWLIPSMLSAIAASLTESPRRIRNILAGIVLVTTAGLCFAEVPHHSSPRVAVPKGTTVYVLGDSISAGMGTNQRCWPTVLHEITNLSIVNLAEPGATVQSAIKQAERIRESNSVVIVEIGGNDLLGGTDAATFRDQLDVLVSSLCSEHHTVLLFELPLFPFQNAFGKAQRSIVAKHGVAMLPKRCFAKVLGTKNGTLDGLHLSQKGHNAMAEIIAGVIHER